MNTIKTIVIATTLMTNIFMSTELTAHCLINRVEETAIDRSQKRKAALTDQLVDAINRWNPHEVRNLLADGANPHDPRVIQAAVYRPTEEDFSIDIIIALTCSDQHVFGNIVSHADFKKLPETHKLALTAAAATKQADPSLGCEDCESKAKAILNFINTLNKHRQS
jgi:hypothetical protein